MDNNAIVVKGVTKTFKVYFDKGNLLKEKVLFWKRNRYEERQVLRGIDFEVKKGEAIALVGHNGCGKSTMLKLLTKIMYPNSGTIETSGRISCLIELGAGFHPDMTGRENVYINASIFGLNKKEIDDRMEEIINFSELRDYIDNPVRTYSSGMYMRLAFAVAINVDADILLIDEILAVGDANFQKKCFNKLNKLKESGKTIVIVTHDTGTVESFCDRAIWIDDGKIAAIGDAKPVVHKYLTYMDTKKSFAVSEIANKSKKKPNLKIDTDLRYSNGVMEGRVYVTNLGEAQVHLSSGENAVNLGISLVDENKQILYLDLFHLHIKYYGIMDENEVVEIPLRLADLEACAAKKYGLRFAIVHENICWYADTAVYFEFS